MADAGVRQMEIKIVSLFLIKLYLCAAAVGLFNIVFLPLIRPWHKAKIFTPKGQ